MKYFRCSLVTLAIMVLVASLLIGDDAFAGDKDHILKALSERSTKPEYSADEKQFIEKLRADRAYVAIEVETYGFENAEGQKCMQNKNISMLKRLFGIEKKDGIVLEANFTIAGRSIENIPLLMITDDTDNCKSYIIRQGLVTPYVRVSSSDDIKIKYKLKTSDSLKIGIFEFLLPTAQNIADLSGGEVKILSKLTEPVIQEAAKKFEESLSQKLKIDTESEVTDTIWYKKNSGFSLAEKGFSIHFKVKPCLSLFVDPRNVKTIGQDLYPDFKNTGSAFLHNPVLPQKQTEREIYDTLYNFFNKNDEAKNALAALSDSSADNFSANFDTMVAEIYGRLGLNEFDTAGVLNQLLRKCPKLKDGKKIKEFGCADHILFGLMEETGLSFAKPREFQEKRDTTLKKANKRIDHLITFLSQKNGESATLKFLSQSFLADGVTIVDPQKIFGDQLGGYSNEKDKIAKSISEFKISSGGCYSSPSDEAFSERSTLLVSAIPNGPRIELKFSFADPDKDDLKVTAIEVSKISPDNEYGKNRLKEIKKTNPSEGCASLLKKYFSESL